ncbi:hypothetical protein F-VV10_0356 [Faustovirus]|nr:hypothetical protein F-VV10_0356 [Faustovirus]
MSMNNDPITHSVEIPNDIIFEIIYYAHDDVILAFAATCRRLRKVILRYYNDIPDTKLSLIDGIFIRLIPPSMIKYTIKDTGAVLVRQDDICNFLCNLKSSDYGCWCVIKDHLQFIGNHRIVKIENRCNKAESKIWTVFRCAHCRKLTNKAMCHPWIHYICSSPCKLPKGDPNIEYPTDIIIEMTRCCYRCASEMDAYWRGSLLDYIRKNNIMHDLITHHDHREIGHCVYRKRNIEYGNNMILNDAEVYAKVIIESGVEAVERKVDV